MTDSLDGEAATPSSVPAPTSGGLVESGEGKDVAPSDDASEVAAAALERQRKYRSELQEWLEEQ